MTHCMKSRLITGLCLVLVLGLKGTAPAAERRVGQGETYTNITAALAATATVAGDTILVTTNVLTEANITVNKAVTIAGLGMTSTIVQAATVRSNSPAPGRVFYVSATPVTIRDMTIRHGYTNGSGGAIHIQNAGTFTLANCNVASNDVYGAGVAGAINNNNCTSEVVSNCVFVGNCSPADGGVHYSGNGTGTPLFYGTTFLNNSSGNRGGVCYAQNGLTFIQCTFVGNRSVGQGSVFNQNSSGAFSLFYNCTVWSNASATAGIYAINIVGGAGRTVINSTVIATNTPLCVNGTSSITITNSLIQYANSIGAGTITNGCIVGQDPLLLPPAANGGLMPTCALQAGSPCIDKGANPLNLSYDQRGPGYPRGWYAPDIGAFEWLPAGRALSYSTNTFYEWFANNGTINNDSPTMRIALANDTFLGTNGQDFVASGLVSASSIPVGLTAVVTRVDSNNVLVTLTGAAAAHTSADNTNNLTVAFVDAAFAGGNAAGVTDSTKSDLNVVYRDAAVTPVLTYTGAGYWEVAANDGSVSNLPIVVTVVNEHFTGTNGQNLAAGGWVTASSLPAGLTLAATKISDFQVNLTLTGAASLPHNVANSVETLAFQFLDSAFFSRPASAVTDASKGGFFVRLLNPTLTYGATTFSESVLNDGSMGNTLTLTLAGDNLTGVLNEDFVAAGKVGVSANVPPGLTAVITRTSPTVLTAALTGNAASHTFADSIANLSFTFQDSAFSNTVANVVTNYLKVNLSVNFITNAITYYVATDGMDVGRTGLSPDQAFKTITNALAKCRSAASDVVQIGAGVFGQTNIALSKVVVVRGMGRDLTILQGGSDTNTTASRFFTTSGGNNRPIVIRDMTMRFGGGRGSSGDNKGGAVHGAAQSPLYLFNCTFVSNTAANGGGAVYLHDDRGYYGQLFVSNCLFRANRTGAGDTQGGAIYNEHWGRVQIDNSTFLENEAGNSGGAVFCSVLMWAQNVTFWGNVARGSRGGAIAKGGSDTYLVNCTIVSNAANPSTGYGGAYRQEAGNVRFLSTVIASNAAPNSSAFYAQGGSIYVTNCVVYGTRSTPAGQGNSILANTGEAGVLPPADNGGSMPTCAIVENSICRNYSANTTALPVDQRGYARDAQPDIGAFEYGAHDHLVRGSVLILR